MPRRFPLLTASFLAAAVIFTAPGVSAKVLAEGKPAGGFYWQKVENKHGKFSYMCRSKGGSKIQPGDQCDKAGAKKP